MMLQHTLKLLLRNIRRFPGTFFINVLGLSTGLACSLLIYLWIADELSFDKFHENESRIYQVVENQRNSSGIVSREATPFGMAYVLGETMPEVELAATVTPMAWFPKFVLEGKGERFKGEGKFVGKNFFKIFSFELLYGNKEHVFSDINSIVISEAMAVKMFGSVANAAGKTIPWSLSNIKKESVVSAIFKNIPSNSSEQFDLVFDLDLLGNIMGFTKKDDLSAPGPSTYVMLKPAADIAAFNKKMSALMSERTGNRQADFFVTKFSDKYLSSGRIEYIKLFSIIGLIILVIACINFMNLSTARASRRMKEVGIKKAVGAWRSSLVVQFFGESLLIAFTSLAVAMLLVGLLLPFFNDITGKQLVFVLTKERVLAFLSITMTTGILAGVYPALYLSGFKPAQILKGKIISSHSETIVRKGLVIFQFAVSIIFILSVLVIHRQMEFIQSRNLGYDKDHIIYFEIEGTVATSLDAFLNDVKAVPGVVNASAIVGNIVGSFGQPFDVAFEDKKVPVNSLMIDYGMIETLGIPMKLGREFSSNFNDNDKVVINKAAADQLGVTDPIGKAITFWDRKFEIVGVTENFHYRSLYEEITPLIFTLETQQLMNVFIRLDGNGQEEGIQNLASFYKTFNPGYTFDYNFLDYAYQAQYKSEKQVASLSLWFSMLAIIIACLGLLGLAAFTAEKKTKEIGIRKVMGATPAGIAWLLSVEFIKLVLIAVAIALPLSFFVIEEWLQRFAYSIDLEIWFFASAGLIAVLIAVATISGQSIKASLANPVDCLKEE